jgi:glycosyltransferase involved in cell wall biosynthesis
MFRERPPSKLTKHIESSGLLTGEPPILALCDRLPHEKIPENLASCHLGLIAYGRAFGMDSLPNRLFEYMAVGLPVLAPSYSEEIRRIVEGEQIGITVDFEDARAVAQAIKWFADNPAARIQMGSRARRAFRARHNWEADFASLLGRMSERS